MSRKIIRTCIDQVAQSPHGIMELAAPTPTLWNPGQTLRVRFMDGDPRIQAKVEGVAHQWSLYANIQFAFQRSQRRNPRGIHPRWHLLVDGGKRRPDRLQSQTNHELRLVKFKHR